MVGRKFRLEDAVLGFDWLGFVGGDCVELCAVDCGYRKGVVGTERRGLWPVVGYVCSVGEYLDFVKRYAGERLVLVGLNPRVGVLRRGGRVVASSAENVRGSRTYLIDIDVVDGGGGMGLEFFLDGRVDVWFRDHGFLRPVRSWSGGGGVHLMLAYPEMLVCDVPDVGERLRCFRDVLVGEFGPELARLGARIDPSTYDLGRRVKAFGTGKPGGRRSRFDAVDREEDAAVRDYLLGLKVVAQEKPGGAGVVMPVGECLPEWFERLMRQDRWTRLLYEGRGKRWGDRSPSGFDFSLVLHLVQLGYRDVGELQTVVWLRPASTARRKGVGYVRRTVAQALCRRRLLPGALR